MLQSMDCFYLFRDVSEIMNEVIPFNVELVNNLHFTFFANSIFLL